MSFTSRLNEIVLKVQNSQNVAHLADHQLQMYRSQVHMQDITVCPGLRENDSNSSHSMANQKVF